MGNFEFVFQGTYEQFEFFKYVATTKIPKSGLFLDNYVGDEFHCSMDSDPNKVFKMGMVLSDCYAMFRHLEEIKFSHS